MYTSFNVITWRTNSWECKVLRALYSFFNCWLVSVTYLWRTSRVSRLSITIGNSNLLTSCVFWHKKPNDDGRLPDLPRLYLRWNSVTIDLTSFHDFIDDARDMAGVVDVCHEKMLSKRNYYVSCGWCSLRVCLLRVQLLNRQPYRCFGAWKRYLYFRWLANNCSHTCRQRLVWWGDDGRPIHRRNEDALMWWLLWRYQDPGVLVCHIINGDLMIRSPRANVVNIVERCLLTTRAYESPFSLVLMLTIWFWSSESKIKTSFLAYCKRWQTLTNQSLLLWPIYCKREVLTFIFWDACYGSM